MSESTTQQAVDLYRLLRGYLRQSAQGRQIVQAFERNQEQADKQLRTYLQQVLPKDPVLARKLASALGSEGDFNTVLIDSQVDQIINIAKLGVLNLNVKYDIFVFSTVWQVVMMSAIGIAVAAAVGFAWWWMIQPAWMTGEFNIAVATFSQEAGNQAIAGAISQQLFDFLEGEYQLSQLGDVQVTHEHIGKIGGADEAERIAAKTNAQLVIYGSVTVINNQASLSPKFYVAESFRSDVGEVNGPHNLSLPVNFEITDVLSPDGVVAQLKQRATVLTEFTKGLAYLQSGEFQLALPAQEESIQLAESFADFPGKEVLYLFASDAARRAKKFDRASYYVDGALTINPSYARGYIARGNLEYEQGQLDLAEADYQHALELAVPPDEAFVFEKAHLNLANVAHNRLLRTKTAEKTGFADLAIRHFQQVIDSVNQRPSILQSNRDRAAWAYYGMGRTWQEIGEMGKAADAYRQVLDFSEDPKLRQETQTLLDEVTIH